MRHATAVGVYTVSLTASGPGGSDTLTRTHYITVEPNLTTRVIQYTYDPLSRLVEADYSSGENFAYAYDAVGNRTAMTKTITSTLVTTYTYDVANRLSAISDQPSAVAWDANGNMLSDGGAAYEYNQANRLISATVNSVNTHFVYNGDGVRLQLIEAGVPTTYTQDLAAPLPVVLRAKTDSDATQYVYSWGTRPLAEYKAMAWEYLLADPLGSVRQIADTDADVTLLKSYEPYGNVLSSQGSAMSIFGYAGEQVDDMGLVYLRARYMEPQLGMFLSRDPWEGDALRPGSVNGWSYTDGNPLSGTDPTGYCTGCTVGSLAKVATGGANLRSGPGTYYNPPILLVPSQHLVTIWSEAVSGRGDAYKWRWVNVFGVGVTGFIADHLLEAALPPLDGLQFTATPVVGPYKYMGGFGANQFAYDSCQSRGNNCPYKVLRGLHNGIDFGVQTGTPVYWTATAKGKVVAALGGDAAPNIVVESGDYQIVFGHMTDTAIAVGTEVEPGTLLGHSGAFCSLDGSYCDPHLHMGIWSPTAVAYYNPAHFFDDAVRASWLPMPYPDGYGEDMLSMKSFSLIGVVNHWDKFFWECGDTPGDTTGIER